MTTINDQPQEKLARYADRTGAKFELATNEPKYASPRDGEKASEYVHLGATIRLVLSEYGLPSHLQPYKDNPRLPGDGCRVPAIGDVCANGLEFASAVGDWLKSAEDPKELFAEGKEWKFNYRLPASVLPLDWDEMTKEDAPTVATDDTSQHPEIFEAHGLEWYHHTPGDPMPCDGDMMVGIALKSGTFDALGIGAIARIFRWGDCRDASIIGWRPADAPAKLPRPEQQPQDAAKTIQTLTARMQELEGDCQMMQGSLLSILGELDCEEPASALLKLKEMKGERDAWMRTAKTRKHHLDHLEAQLAAASTPTLRPIAEMPAEVPEGFKRIFWSPNSGWWGTRFDGITHSLDIRLPAPPDPDEELRQEFEAWATKTFGWHPDKFTLKESSGEYLDDMARPAFQAYKAGRVKEGAR